jgi:hypothetical protein
MPLRRILVVLLLFMVTMSIAASLTTRTNDAPLPRRSAPAQPGLVRTLTATIPREHVVRAATGDRIVLTVVADATDQVQIDGYDLVAPVDPDTPARFDFIADQAGRFAVGLTAAGKALGRLEVVERP